MTEPTHLGQSGDSGTWLVTFELEVVPEDLLRNDQPHPKDWNGLQEAIAADDLGLVYAFRYTIEEL